MYSDHDFESDVAPGTNQGRCVSPVMVYNQAFDHDFPHDEQYCTRCKASVRFITESWYEGEPASGRSECDCPEFPGPITEEIWVCAHCKQDRFAPQHMRRKEAPCGAPASSVLHPPDQFRHWCEALEAGYDCMHFEDDGS